MALADGVGVRETARAGAEAYALRAFQKGEVVLSDKPFAVLLSDLQRRDDVRKSADGAIKESCAAVVSYDPPDAATYWKLLNDMSCPKPTDKHEVIQCVAAVCEVLAEAYKGTPLLSHWPDQTPSAATRTVLVWLTNGLRYKGATALFPVASKVNHCCEPNVQWDPDLGCFLALRPIGAGEAFGMNYLDKVASGKEDTFSRCSRLYLSYLFWCQCPRCERDRQWRDGMGDDTARHTEFRIATALMGTPEAAQAQLLFRLAVTSGMGPGHFVLAKLAAHPSLGSLVSSFLIDPPAQSKAASMPSKQGAQPAAGGYQHTAEKQEVVDPPYPRDNDTSLDALD
eukprot:TRINITY_DN81470_c0_g1_i1.p1 TRINITY_DN81470_c0_g1~~TRINITY_DN81470_c0_g1_i1.p1  ORF type:complete len:340 (+),score=49.26 TRINITY_DN81470_c0_g1_i1:40-1059(+)